MVVDPKPCFVHTLQTPAIGGHRLLALPEAQNLGPPMSFAVTAARRIVWAMRLQSKIVPAPPMQRATWMMQLF
jgi:hypothetical protein